MPRKQITPGAREGLLAMLTVALEQPVPQAYHTFTTGVGGVQGANIQKPFPDYLNVLSGCTLQFHIARRTRSSLHTVLELTLLLNVGQLTSRRTHLNR